MVLNKPYIYRFASQNILREKTWKAEEDPRLCCAPSYDYGLNIWMSSQYDFLAQGIFDFDLYFLRVNWALAVLACHLDTSA